MKRKHISIEDFYNLIDDPKTDYYLIFEQMMNYMAYHNNKKYEKTLLRMGRFIDDETIYRNKRQKWERDL